MRVLESSLRPWLALLGVFASSRALAFAAGLRFDLAPLASYWQFADPELLEHHLFATVAHLHAQPPLFNLLVGMVLHAPFPPVWTFCVLYLACGFAVAAGSFHLLRAVGLGPWMAVAVASALVLRPGFLLLEAWLFYDLPVTALLVLALVALERALRLPTTGRLLAFSTALSLLALTRALFHPLFVAAAVGGAMLGLRRVGRRSGSAVAPEIDGGVGSRAAWNQPRGYAVALAPVVLVLAFATLQFARFGVLGGSSWLGMNLARVVRSGFTELEIERMQEDGLTSEVFSIPPFSPLEDYPEALRSGPAEGSAWSRIPLLNAPRKSTGAVNFHHLAWVRISKAYLYDALRVAGTHPLVFAGSLARSAYHLLSPLTDLLQLQQRLASGEERPALACLERIDRVWRSSMLPLRFLLDGKPRAVYPLLALFVLTSIAAGGWVLRARRLEARTRVLLALILGICLYTLLVGTVFETLENQRFRAYVDPLLCVLLASGYRSTRPAGRGASKSRLARLKDLDGSSDATARADTHLARAPRDLSWVPGRQVGSSDGRRCREVAGGLPVRAAPGGNPRRSSAGSGAAQRRPCEPHAASGCSGGDRCARPGRALARSSAATRGTGRTR